MSVKSISLPWSHILLLVVVTAIWGSNFVVIKIGLGDLPPLMFATLRFCLVLLPWVFFIPRPKVSWLNLAAYGLLIGAGPSGFSYIALQHDISPGLASVVLQGQVFFTIGLSMWIYHERIRLSQIFALILATVGLGIIISHHGNDATLLGVGLILLAGLSWAIANLLSKSTGNINIVAYLVWSGIFAIPPLFILSLIFEGWPAIKTGLAHANAGTWAVVLHQSLSNSIFGFGSWGWLLARHPAASIAPFSLLVPIFGLSASALFLGEPMQPWKLLASCLVIGGLVVNVVWPHLWGMVNRWQTIQDRA